MVMARCSLQSLLSGVLFLAISTGTLAAKQAQTQILDLHYAEVLYYFYQQDYFTSITHLMAARQQGRLQHHAQDADLLLGGMQLSYGLLDEAESRFRRLLDGRANKKIRNRIWYYLSKIAYQRGRYEKAYLTLNEIDSPEDEALRAETAMLGATVRMALGKDGEAAEVLSDLDPPAGWEEYLQINRGIALLRAGALETGRSVLDSIGQREAETEELRALRDRANLGLGYQLLRVGQPQQARTYLNRVRLSGPFSAAALLGAGWADAAQGEYQSALTPWLALTRLAGYEAPVQEAQLAVPYALARLGDHERAVHFGDQAIGYYNREQEQLKRAVAAVESGKLASALSQADTGRHGGWLNDNPVLEQVPAAPYLVDVLSGHAFQEALKDYRDLGFIEARLTQWLQNSSIYDDMVEARREAYERRAPLIRRRLERRDAQTASGAWNALRAQLQTQAEKGDPLGLANTTEKRQWQLLHRIQQEAATLPDTPDRERITSRARWLQGVLYWQIQTDYKARLWEIRKLHAGVEAPIAAAVAREKALHEALDAGPASFAGYDERIAALRERMLALLVRVQLERGKTIETVQQLAMQELQSRKERLASYRSQAQYALARSYDALAHRSDSAP
jgi:hypothetical protein